MIHTIDMISTMGKFKIFKIDNYLFFESSKLSKK